MRHSLICILAASLLAVPAAGFAQAPGTSPQAQPQPPPAAPLPAPGARPEPPERRVPQTTLNVKTDITITDQAGTNPPVTKTISLIVADHEGGSIRSEVTLSINANTPPGSPPRLTDVELPLNADVKADVLESGRIRLRLALNYRTATPSNNAAGERKSEVTENTTLILESGKSTMISQSADAATDRKVTVELKATILK